MVLNSSSKMDPQNLSEFLMYLKVASKINLFLILSRLESPYHLFHLCQARTHCYQ